MATLMISALLQDYYNLLTVLSETFTQVCHNTFIISKNLGACSLYQGHGGLVAFVLFSDHKCQNLQGCNLSALTNLKQFPPGEKNKDIH